MNRENKPYQVFISYRRNGSDAHARLFYDKLKNLGYRVFLDFESLYSGGFSKNALSAVRECRDFLLLIPKGGLDRCGTDENDLFRLEIRTAIEEGKNVIPVMISGFAMPAKDTLPPDIAEIADQNGIECDMEYFDSVFERVCRYLTSEPEDPELFAVIGRLRRSAEGLEHPYFRKWAGVRLNAFLDENDGFFRGTNRTNPHSEETFGITGIAMTEHSVRAITSVSDYWEDGFAAEYLGKQSELAARGVRIDRIFIIEEGKLAEARKQMEFQKAKGINVYYIVKGNPFIDPEWLEEDYLIQDDRLLVQIFCATHRFAGQNSEDELITMDRLTVARKIERFRRILERSTPLG